MNSANNSSYPTPEGIEEAYENLPSSLIYETPLRENIRLSRQYSATILLKDESQQRIRSYKGRGSATAMRRSTDAEKQAGFVCSSAGNHAQGFASACEHYQLKGKVFMPTTTPGQKVEATERFGNGNVTIELVGDTFDETQAAALEYTLSTGKRFIHPFDDKDTIEGQGTVALEMLKQAREMGKQINTVVAPIGGGGLTSGLAVYLRKHSADTRLIGIEPQEAAAMHASLQAGELCELEAISTFVDGAAVKKPGSMPFDIIRKLGVEVATVPEDRVCSSLYELHRRDGIVAEPAGALSIDGLKDIADDIRGQTVACVLSGSNFDPSRYADVKERATTFEQRKKYLQIHVPNRSGAFMEFLAHLQKFDISITNIMFSEKENGPTQTVYLGIRGDTPSSINQLMLDLDDTPYDAHDITNDSLRDAIIK